MKISGRHKKLAEANRATYRAWIQMFSKREESAYFRLHSKEAADNMVSGLVRKATATYLRRLQENAKEVRKKMQLKRGFIRLETVTENVPRPYLCIRIIEQDLHIPIMEAGLHEYALGEAGTFLFWYDVAHGISQITGSVPMALDAEKETTCQRMRAVDELERGYAALPYQKQIDGNRWKAEAEDAARLLHDDPSGFTLIDATVAEIKAGAGGRPVKGLILMESYQIPEFVIAGAEQAQTVYKALYPLTENL